MTAVNLNRAVRGPVTAVPIVAGHGVRIVPDVENNRFVAEADETVLYDGETTGTSGNITLSESLANFERIGIFFSIGEAYEQGEFWYGGKWAFFEAADLTVTKKFCISDNMNNGNNSTSLNFRNQSYTVSNDNLTLTYLRSTQLYYNGSSWAASTSSTCKVYKVIGVNRIASN